MLQVFRDLQARFGKQKAEQTLTAIRSGIFITEVFRAYKDGYVEEKPYEVIISKNSYVNTGGALWLDLLIGAGGTVYSAANAYIGVGDSATAVAASQTDLQASTNKLRLAMDATYPSRSGQTVTWKSTFSTSQANWQWNENALFNNSSAGTMLARAVVSSPITKTSAASMTQTYQITVP